MWIVSENEVGSFPVFLLGPHVYNSSSQRSHNYNCNFTLRILLGFFCAWSSEQLCLQDEVSTHCFKYFKKIEWESYLVPLLKWKKKDIFPCSWKMRGFLFYLLFKNNTCKASVEPTQLQNPLTIPILSTHSSFYRLEFKT